jgi:hypothetical protein
MSALARRRWAILACSILFCSAASAFLVARFTRHPPTYTEIEPGLFLGGYLFSPPPGVRAVLNVCKTEDCYRAEVHRWQPIRNAEPGPTLDWVRVQIDFIDAQRRSGRPVFVHCHGGVSRSAMVVVAHLMERHGWNRDQALDYVRERRPVVCLNPVFDRVLLEWERTLSARR